MDVAAACGANEVSIHENAISRDLVDRIHAHGMRANSWLITRDRLPELVATGIDGVVTDWPEDAAPLRH